MRQVDQSELNVRPVDLNGLPQEFMNPGELDVLVALIRTVREPREVVEIGVNSGRTAAVILREVKDVEHYVGIDVPRDYVPGLPVQAGERPRIAGFHAEDDIRFDVIIPRRGSLDLRPADLGPVDLVFIDGDHSRAAVEHDTALAHAIVQPGGMVIWHDYSNDRVEVTEVLDQLVAAGHDITHVLGTWLAFERR